MAQAHTSAPQAPGCWAQNPWGKLPLVPNSRSAKGGTQGPPSPGHRFSSSSHSQHPSLLGKRRKEKPAHSSLRNISPVASGIYSPGSHNPSRHTHAPSNSQKNSFPWAQTGAQTPDLLPPGSLPGTCVPLPTQLSQAPATSSARGVIKRISQKNPNVWLL